MKKIILILCICVLKLSAQTNVSGGIFSNTTWTVANSPYIITNNIVVFPGATLTIQPGVEVRVKLNPSVGFGYFGSFGYKIEVRGTLNAIGNVNSKIKFKSDTSIVGATDLWYGILEKRSQNGKVNIDYVDFSDAFVVVGFDANSATGLTFHHSKFKNNAFISVDNLPSIQAYDCEFSNGINIFQGLTQSYTLKRCQFLNNQGLMSIYPTTLIIDSCLFKNNGGYINLPYPVNNFMVTNSDFINNGGGFAFANGGQIKKCKFKGNTSALLATYNLTVDSCKFDSNGIAISTHYGTAVINNHINNNQVGVLLGNYAIGLPANNISNNKICNNNYNLENGSDKNLSVYNNCFCETDSAIIESKIYDGYDDVSRGLLSYNIYDSACNILLKSVNKLGSVLLINSNVVNKSQLFYPNPVRDFLTIDDNYYYNSAQITDMNGSIIKNMELKTGQNQLNLSELSKGIYSIKLTSNNKEILYYKLIKE